MSDKLPPGPKIPGPPTIPPPPDWGASPDFGKGPVLGDAPYVPEASPLPHFGQRVEVPRVVTQAMTSDMRQLVEDLERVKWIRFKAS